MRAIRFIVLCAWFWCANVCAGDQYHGVIPEPLRANDVEQALVRYGDLTLDDWLAIEQALAAYDERIERDHAPLVDAFLAANALQHWMNWPQLKRPEERKSRDAIVDHVVALGTALYAEIAARVPSRAEAARRAGLALRRTTLDVPMLEHAGLVDLAARWAALSPAERDATSAAIRAWEIDFDERCAHLRASHHAVLDAFSAALVREDIDPWWNADDRATWLPRAHEIWLRESRSLRGDLIDALRAQRQSIDAVAAALRAEEGERWRRAALADAYRLPPGDDRAVIDRIERRLRTPALGETERETLPAIVTEARAKTDSAFTRWMAQVEGASPLAWGLSGGGWDAESGSVLVDERRTLVAERRRALQLAEKRLATMSLPDAVELDPATLAYDAAVADAPRWLERRPCALLPRFPASDRGWLDAGAIDAPTAARLGEWIGFDADVTAVWTALCDDFRSAYRATLATTPRDAQRSAWSYSSHGYTYDESLAVALSAAAEAQWLYVRSEIAKLRDGARLLVRDERSGRRLEAVLIALAIDCDLGPLIAMDELHAISTPHDRRAAANPLAVAILRAPFLVVHDAAIDDMRVLHAIVARRAERAVPTALRAARLADRLVWLRDGSAVALRKELAKIVADWRAADANERAAQAMVADALVLSWSRIGGSEPALRAAWNETAFPSLFGLEPPAVLLCERVVAVAGDGARTVLAEIADRYLALDAAHTDRLRTMACDESTNPKLIASIMRRREQLSERIVVALRRARTAQD